MKVYTGGNNEIIIEYDIASNIEIWNELGGSIENPRDCEYFWAVYLENILYRPEEYQLIEAAYLNIDIPSGWDFATVYLRYGNTVELGTINYMYGDNIRWMNYQRGGLILFKEGPFLLKSKNIYGVEVQDVYSKEYPTRCCEANFQYFEYLCDHIGILPINGVLTFCPRIETSIQYIRTYQAAPLIRMKKIFVFTFMEKLGIGFLILYNLIVLMRNGLKGDIVCIMKIWLHLRNMDMSRLKKDVLNQAMVKSV